MPIPVDQTVLDALAGSYIWEEQLGDFRLARLRAEALAANAADLHESAVAAFSLGVVHLLRGQVNRARSYWNAAEAYNLSSESWILLLAAFRHLADFEQWNTKLDGVGAEAIEINAHWDTAEVMQVKGPRLNQLRASCTDLEAKNLAWLLNEIFGVGKNMRSTAQYWQTAPFSEEALQLFRQALENMSRSAAAAKRDGLRSYMVLPLWLRAEIFHKTGQNEAAREALDQAEQTAREENDEARVAMCLLSRGDWLAATFSTPLAWDFALFDSSQESSALIAQTEHKEWPALSHSQADAARSFYEEALLLYKNTDAYRGVAQVQLRLAYLSMRAGKAVQAEALTVRAEALFRQHEDYRGVMLSRTHRILAQLWQEKWLTVVESAGTIGRWGRWSGDFSFTHSLGILINRFARHLFLRHGRYEGARIAYRAAATLFTELPAPINAIQNQVDQALLHEAVGDFTTAGAEVLNAAARFMQLIASPPPYWPLPEAVRPFLLQHAIMLTSKAYNISNGLMDWEQLRNAREQIKALIVLLNPNGILPDRLPENVDETRLFGMTQLALSMDQEASFLIPYYRYKQEERKLNETPAEFYWKAAFQAAEQLPQDRRLFYQAVLWGSKRNYEQAGALHEAYLALRTANLPELPNLVNQNAPFVHDDELKITQHRHFWEQTFGMWIQLAQYKKALAAWQERCALEDDAWWERESAPWRTGNKVAEMYEALGDYDLALQYCDRCLEMLEGRRNELSRDELRTAIANDKGAQFLYHLGARLSLRQDNPEKAFFYIEQGKARALLDLLSAKPDQLMLDGQQQSLLRQWREGHAKLQAYRGLLSVERRRGQTDQQRFLQLQEEIQQTTVQIQSIEQDLIAEIPTFFSTAGGSGKLLTIKALQSELEEGQLFISYSYYDGDLYIWAINRNGLLAHAHQQVAYREMRDLSLELHRACQGKADYHGAAKTLGDYLLQPLYDILDTHRQVYIAPSGNLFLVPFQVLPFRQQSLGASHVLSFLPSASSLQYFPSIDLTAESRALVVGNPTGDLKAAAVEASFIAQLFHTNALIGEAATEQALRQSVPGANILHLATHGQLSEEAPLASSLALANGEELSLYEMMGMQLTAELVVLSACETGKGNTTNGDDVVGLTRGLLAAGAKSAIVSFWSVDDTSTALFMKHFYRHLQQHRSPATALTFAQKQLRQTSQELALKELDDGLAELPQSVQRNLRGIKLEREETDYGYEHPFYWAPFFYVGRF